MGTQLPIAFRLPRFCGQIPWFAIFRKANGDEYEEIRDPSKRLIYDDSWL